MERKYALELIELFSSLEKKNKDSLNHIKKEIAKKYKIKIPTNIEIYTSLPDDVVEKYKALLLTKPVRTLSGVSVVAIMAKPEKCPHGKCSFCPGGINSHFGDVPQSYTGREPATMRAMRANYNPYIQVFSRLEQFTVLGQLPEKIELIIMGGTFLAYEKKYKREFVMYAFKAMNDFSDLFFRKKVFDFKKFKKFFLLPGSVEDLVRVEKVKKKILQLKKKSTLEKEQEKNEKKSNIKCVGFTMETRPDYATIEHAKEMREYGITRVEIGVETIYEDILKKFKRGHSIYHSISATRIMRDFGFKINYHIMLGLSDRKKDIEMFDELFASEAFKPDMLKIYPLMVFPGTELYDEWKKGNYIPLTTEKAVEIIVEIKKIIPPYVRIMRIQRDIPTEIVSAGVDRTNLRQYVDKILQGRKIKCKCIRCREVKGREVKNYEIVVREYDASAGKEFFISAENPETDILLGFTRLRFPATFLTKEISKNSAIIRELHVYGAATSIGETGVVQHRGIGKKLMAKAEEIAKKHKKKKIVIISGIGVRGYYRKLGYRLEGTYMVKKI
jgi:elongator complex protein 3